MDSRAAALVALLDLVPHPEGGYYREIYRSASAVQPFDARPPRSALTTIFFLLPGGVASRWHRVGSDEVWHFYEGDPLELMTADPAFDTVIRRMLGTIHEARSPVHVVRAGDWQAARSVGAYSLVGCTVGPGFDFTDFQMLRDAPADAAAVRRRHPDAAVLI